MTRFYLAAEVLDKRFDDARVKVSARPHGQCNERLLGRPRLAVAALFGYRVVGIGYRDDPAADRNLFALQTVRISGAVPSLVMCSRHKRHFGKIGRKANVRQQSKRMLRMLLYVL